MGQLTGATANSAAAIFVFFTLVALALHDGGYFETSWGWTGLALAWIAAMVLVIGIPISLSRLELGWLAGLTGIVAWAALSMLWSGSFEQPIREVERNLLYPLGAFLFILLARRAPFAAVAAALAGAIVLVSSYALATRLFPERVGAFDPLAYNRLSEPLGYWNALAIWAVIGIPLALGLAARAGHLVLRAAAGAALPLLFLTLYFTFSRGGWIALVVAVSVAIAVDPRRLQLTTAAFALTPLVIVSLALANRAEPLTRQTAPLAEVTRSGHRLAVELFALSLASATVAVAVAVAERRLRVSARLRTSYAAALVTTLVLVLGGLFVHFGDPVTLARRAYDDFKAPPLVTAAGANFNQRFSSLSGNGRYSAWRVALRTFETNQWLGSGAGSYERHWLEKRPFAGNLRDAHSLPLETLAELGPVGLVLIGAALLFPLLAGARTRSTPLVPFVLASYLAYVVHATADWDWEMPAVTFAGLFCGGALLAHCRATQQGARPWARGAALVAVAVAAGISLVGLVGNTAIDDSATALARVDYGGALEEAERGRSWAPWAATPWEYQGDAQVGRGEIAAARASYRRALEKNRDDWELWLKLALVTDGRERLRAALRARTLNPRSVEIAELSEALGIGRR